MLCCGLSLKRRGKNAKPKDADKENEAPAEQQQQSDPEKKNLDAFVKEILDGHNKYRQHHQVEPLDFSQELTDSAQKWAEHLASLDKLDHDPDCQKQRIGENVAMKYSSAHTDFPGSAFVDSWYSEAAEYKFNGKEDQIECGHFTQVVWKASKEAGFGKAISSSGKVYVVGRYKPAGNYTGDFTRNVLPPKDGSVMKPQQQPEAAKSQAGSEPVVKPVIGPDCAGDTMVETQTVTKTVGNKKVVKVTETYRKPDGSTYSKTKETTSFDEN